jgi:predicted metal-dependent enzyme (double-stranded beta helix superfamily)
MDVCEVGLCCYGQVAGIVEVVTTRTATTLTEDRAPAITRGIADLAGTLTSIVRTGAPALETARLVAGALQDVLPQRNLLTTEQRTGTPDCYTQHVLYADPAGEFSIVSLVWQPGQKTCIHDHISWCVVGVYEGAEESTLYAVDGDELVVTGHMVDQAGTTSYFVPPGDIHAVCNSTDETVISIHVYGADVSVLGSSIRRRYDLRVRG